MYIPTEREVYPHVTNLFFYKSLARTCNRLIPTLSVRPCQPEFTSPTCLCFQQFQAAASLSSKTDACRLIFYITCVRLVFMEHASMLIRILYVNTACSKGWITSTSSCSRAPPFYAYAAHHTCLLRKPCNLLADHFSLKMRHAMMAPTAPATPAKTISDPGVAGSPDRRMNSVASRPQVPPNTAMERLWARARPVGGRWGVAQ